MSATNIQGLSKALTVISANIEGLTAAKASMLSEMCKREKCHCLCLQETHRSTNLPRPKIAGMSLIVERPHNKYGSAILIRDDLKVTNVHESVQGNIEVITIVMPGVAVHSVYKPPNEQFKLPSLGHSDLPHIVIGDFNSHSTTWGYETTDDNGEVVMNDTIMDAITLRKKVVEIQREKQAEKDWFFGMWQPERAMYRDQLTDFLEIPDDYIASHQHVWTMNAENNWHGFKDMEDDYAMLDPIKLTFTMPGINPNGTLQEEGIPASIVSDFLINEGIVVEKTDYYSFLLLNSLGTTKGNSQASTPRLMLFSAICGKYL